MDSDKEGFLLSKEEMAIVGDSSWIMAKLRVIQKVYALYGELSRQYAAILSRYGDVADDEVFTVSSKIYKGESYLQLPYVMMDHPRFFKRKDVFAIRSFFWWGNSFSIHLLLGGKYKALFEKQLSVCMQNGVLDTWYAGVADDPWQHCFEPDNYRLIENNAEELVPAFQSGDYLKLANVHPFGQWDGARDFYVDSFTFLMQLLSASQQDH